MDDEFIKWVGLIDERLGKRKKFNQDQRTLFAGSLLTAIPETIEWVQMVTPGNDDVKAAREKAQNLTAAALALSAVRDHSPLLQEIEASASFSSEEYRGIDFRLIAAYARRLEQFLEDNYKFTSIPGPNNRTSLAVCRAICSLYKKCLKELPHTYPEDRIGQSGDTSKGTPYERVCRAVEERFAVSLPWSTQVQAEKTFDSFVLFDS